MDNSAQSRNVKKRIFGHVRPAKIQISLSLIRIFNWRILDSQGCKVSSCGQRRLISDCADAQADMSLRWAHMSNSTFFDVAVSLRGFEKIIFKALAG